MGGRMPHNPTLKAMNRALTTSFGSICFGSLVIAVVKALRAMVNMSRQSDNSFVKCIAECILACIERIIQYINVYAFSYVAIYG